VAVDVRLIAATTRDLRAEVNAGRFRPDVYYRLAVITIVQPSLRERPADLPVLAEQLLSSLGADRARVDALLTPQLMERMQRAAWPGNIRELRNSLERCLAFDEAAPLADAPAGDAAAAPSVRSDLPYTEARQAALTAFERAYLQALLREHGGVAAAAGAAGIDRTYFYRLLRRHRLGG
jgi:DNA-binding NtrC family response regulator